MMPRYPLGLLGLTMAPLCVPPPPHGGYGANERIPHKGGETTAYVCELGLCHQPEADVATLKSQLAIVEPLP